MQKNILYKTPLNSRKIALYKNNSYTNIFPKSANKIVYKIRERLFTPNSLSLLKNKINSKINSNFTSFKSNYKNMMKNLLSYDVDLNEEKNQGIKSLDNLIITMKNLTTLSVKKNFFKKKKTEERQNEFLIPEFINNKKKKRLKLQTSTPIQKRFFSEKKKNKEIKFFSEKKFEEFDNDGNGDFKLVNQILGLDKTISNQGKNLKDILPLKLDKNYDDFIKRKIKLNYNPNFNSPNIHRMSLNFMLNQITKNMERKKSLIQSRKKLEEKNNKEKKLKLDKELIQEMRDKFDDIPVDFEKIKKSVRIFLTDETKLNQISEIKEKFFDNYENKINFLFDYRRFPIIKNNLNKEKLSIRASKDKEWTKLNSLENCTLIYLNKLRVKLQNELDEIKGENKEKKFRLYQDIKKYEEENKNNDIEENYTSVDFIIKLMKNEKINSGYNLDDIDENVYISEKEDLYELEEFFGNKSTPYKKIDFANDKLSHIVFHNKEFYNLRTKNIFKEKNDNKRKSLANVYI